MRYDYMGPEFLLVIPVFLCVSFTVIKSLKKEVQRIIALCITAILIIIYLFVFPGLVSLRIGKKKPYVSFYWDGGRRYEKAKKRMDDYVKKQMNKNGVKIYGSDSF